MKCKCCDNRIFVDGNNITIRFTEQMMLLLKAQERAGMKDFSVSVEVGDNTAKKINQTLLEEEI